MTNDSFINLFLKDEICPFYSSWEPWSWIKEGNRENPIKIMDGSFHQQNRNNGHSYSCLDTCGKRIQLRERTCYQVNLKGKFVFDIYLIKNFSIKI